MIRKIIHADFLNTELPPEMFRTVIIDPPYNAPVEARTGGSTGRLKRWITGADNATWFSNDDLTPEQFQEFFLQTLKKCYQAAESGAHLYLFCSRWRIADFERVLALAGWTVRNWLIWNKEHIGMGYYWRHQAEFIIFCTKGKTQRFVMDKGNVISVPRISSRKVQHPNQKPIELYRRLIEASGAPVLEPFAGTAPAALAAQTLDGECWSIEQEERFCRIAQEALHG